METLLMASIGPVQPFIAAARRTRDLWFGSWVLSELSKAAAYSLLQQGATLIFPSPEIPEEELQPESDLILSNKIVAIVNKTPSDICSLVKQAIIDRIIELGNQAFADVPQEELDHDIGFKQLEDLIEFTWAQVPYLEERRYFGARRNAEALLAIRKRTHNFNPATWGAPIPKSSLDGQRESVISRLSPESRTQFDIKPGEQLSGIDLLKRRGQHGDQQRFLSTSHIAALPFMCHFDGINSSDLLVEAWKTYHSSLPQHLRNHEQTGNRFPSRAFFEHADGALLFRERLDFEQDMVGSQSAQEARNKLDNFFKLIKHEYSMGEPQPYYAVLQADGDSMGHIIDREAKGGPDRHRLLSKALGGFAKQARSIILEHDGAAVYAGGDDILAFLPLHTLFACIIELGKIFDQKLTGFSDEEGRVPSFSAGVAIVHHLVPLTDALELARSAENLAKTRVRGKDALALTISKRSGSDTTIYDNKRTLIEQLQRIIEWHRKALIPDSAAYELREITQRLRGPNVSTMDKDVRHSILQLEATRIIKRKVKDPEVQKSMLNLFDEKGWLAERFANELIVARLFADAYDLAYGKVQ